MSLQAGLPFEQAPPVSLPLRFFLTAPLFLLAAAGLIVLSPDALASRWTPQALALTHALTLGFLAWFHLQAQLQAHAGSIPTMKDMIAERWKRGQFRMHVFACVLLVAAVFNPPAFALPAGITLGLSALFLWVNLLFAVRRFTSQGGNLT